MRSTESPSGCVQLLDPVLDVAALAVDLFVEPLRTLLHVGDYEARVVFGLFAFAANHLGLDQDAALPVPAPGRVVDFAVDVFGLSGTLAIRANNRRMKAIREKYCTPKNN